MNKQNYGIIAWFVHNHVAANLLMAGILILGILSALHIRKEFFPQIETGRININVVYPGAAPEDVEQGPIVKIEEKIQGVVGIKKISSSSYEGMGNVSVTVLNSYDVDKVMAEIKSKVEGITNFSEEVKRPVISKETTRSGVMWLVLSGDLSGNSLKMLAQEMKDELIADNAISLVEIEGTRNREIRIEVSESTMHMYDLSFDDITTALRNSSLNLPAGKIRTQKGDVLLRTNTQAYTRTDFENIPIVSRNDGTLITLAEVASIVDGFEETDWFLRFQGNKAVGLQVFRVGNQSTLDVAEAARSYVQRKRLELPSTVRLDIIDDNSVILKDRLQLMLKNLGIGSLLVFFSLILFLRLRVAFWIMVGLPLCFLGTIWFMPTPLINISINMITLFGFILVLGIVVDDAIIIGESIHANVEKKGGGVDNVIEGARNVATAATFGVLTTIAAFVPMLLMSGINGKIWKGIGLVVILCLFFSLVESKLILPAHLSSLKPCSKDREKTNLLDRLQTQVSHILTHVIHEIYKPFLELALKNWLTTLTIFLAILILTAGMIKRGSINFVFFPDIEGNTIQANLRLIPGTSLAKSLEITEHVERAAQSVNHKFKQEQGYSEDVIKSLIAVSISHSKVWFYAELLPSEKRNHGAKEIIRHWRAATGAVVGVESLEFSGSTTDSGKPISFSMRGNDPEKLHAAANDMKKLLSTYEGVHDTKTSLKTRNKEMSFELQPGATLLGINNIDLARQIRHGFYGNEVQTLQRGKDEIKVRVLYPNDERKNIDSLSRLHLRTNEGDKIPFTEIADMRNQKGYASLDHINGLRVVQVSANVDKEMVEPQKIISDIKKQHFPSLLQKYKGLSIELAGGAAENEESLEDIKRGVVLSLILIYAMLAIPLKSYIQPLVIMAVIPFGAVGAILGHFLLNLPVSVLSLCGIAALSGVVVNDSLVMVDFINSERRKGKTLITAVKEAGAARFRAILLTSLTTFLGLLPMLMERSLQAQFLIPMSVSLAFGILFATAITLILVPTLYIIGCVIKGRIRNTFMSKKAVT